METDNTSKAQALTSEELQAILEQYPEYEPEAVLAAIEELQKRGQEIPELEQLQQALQQAAQHEAAPEKETPAQKAKNFLMLFVPQPHYQVTPVILNINLLVFILGAILGLDMINPDAGRLVEMGANFGPFTLTGEWWRLLTSMFLHGGILHLLLNMMALVNIGAQLEALVGRTQFLLAYLLCGLAGSVTSLWWTSPEISVSVGASGAIFGMFGMLLILLVLERELDWGSKRAILTNMAVVIGINLLYGMRGGIDNAAHIGGLVAGVVYGAVLLLRSGRYITVRYSTVGNAVTVVVGLAVLVGFFSYIPFNGKVRWVYTLEQLGRNESIAMEALVELDKAGDNYEAAKVLPMVEKGIVLWEETALLLASIDDAPTEEQDKLSALQDYVRLRKMSYELLQEDLKNRRPLMHQKQQQVLGAIKSYLDMLQTNDFSSLASNRLILGEPQLNAEFAVGSEEEPEDAASLANSREPLFILDGKEVGRAPKGEMLPAINELDFSKIEKVTVLKAEEAVKIYGEKGAWGVVTVITKKE